MSKVPYTVDVNTFVCAELDDLRKMYKNRDFSGMMACIERIQHHASRMEEALFTYHSGRGEIRRSINDEELTDKQTIKEIRKIVGDN